MFGRLQNVRARYNSLENVGDSSDSSDSEDKTRMHTPPTAYIRTQLLILDYKQFKAARLIQKVIRGWLVRNKMKKRYNAAVVIQRAWWRYIGKSFRSSMAQDLLQTDIVQTFNDQSLKIQSLFRGWHSRRYINNLSYLNMIQKNALEDIITNMAHKMYKANQRNEIPGILSFTDSGVKIEQFLSTLTYRIYNRFVGNNLDLLHTMRAERRVDFLNSAKYTKVPFLSTVQDCSRVVTTEMFDRFTKRYSVNDFEVAEAFKSANDPRTAKSCKLHALNKMLQLEKEMNKKKVFCRDVFKRMSRWSIFDNGNLEYDECLTDSCYSELFAAVKKYLLENNLMEDCYCQRDTKPEGYFAERKL